MRPVPHSTTVPVPIFKGSEEESENDSEHDRANESDNTNQDEFEDIVFNPSSTDKNYLINMS